MDLDRLPHGVTAHTRTDGSFRYLFLENYNADLSVRLPLGQVMTDLLTGEQTSVCQLPAYGFAVLRSQEV